MVLCLWEGEFSPPRPLIFRLLLLLFFCCVIQHKNEKEEEEENRERLWFFARPLLPSLAPAAAGVSKSVCRKFRAKRKGGGKAARSFFLSPSPSFYFLSVSELGRTRITKGTRGLSISMFLVSSEKNYFSGAFLSNHVLLTSTLR